MLLSNECYIINDWKERKKKFQSKKSLLVEQISQNSKNL